MKKLLLLTLCLVAFMANAQIGSTAPWMAPFNDSNRSTEPTFQEIVDAFDSYWEGKDETVKGSGFKPFKRWESLYANYLNEDGTVMSHKQLWDVWQQINSQSRSTQVDDSDWRNIGPLTHTNTGSWSAGQGRVNAFAVDPTNPNTLFVGTPAGGIWKSTDAGDSWTPLTDQLPQIGVSGIAIDPTDTNIIYIATGDDDAGDSTSIGVMKSTDGGATWSTTGLNESNTPASMNEIYFDPADSKTLWVATNNGIYKTTDSGVTWDNVLNGDFDDLKVKPGSSDVLYAADASRVFRTLDGGNNWTSISTGVIIGAARLVMDVTPANPDVLYVFRSDNTFGSGTIFKSSNSGDSFTQTFTGGQDIFESSQAWFDFAFAVSDTDENEIYTGILNVWKSTNSGANFTKLNNWNDPNTPSYTHADIHNLRFINGTLYCGSDGGFYSSNDGGVNFTSHTDGLAIGQFYRIDVAPEDASIISGGLQDNGGYARKNGMWQNYYGADGMENVYDPNDPSKVYGFIQSGGGPYFSNDGGASLSGSFASPETGNWITPLAFAKDKRLYAGYSRIYELDFCSNSWVQRSSSFGPQIDLLETDPNDASIMYVAVNGTLYKSSNRGVDFTILRSFPEIISSIEVKYGDSNTIYIVTAGTAGKVYEGTVTDNTISVNDITGSLPAIPKLVIKHQSNHSDNPLFLGTALGIWKYDDITNDWETFDNGLPNTAVRDLDVNEFNGVLTAGTYGRGIWQTDIEIQPLSSDIAATSLAPLNNQVISCGENPTEITFRNNGTSSITEATITYEAGGIQNSMQWTGNLAAQEEATLELPVLGLPVGTYELIAQITTDGDQVEDNNEKRTSIAINEVGEIYVVNDFETAESDLLVLTENANASCDTSAQTWQRGIPTGTILNQAASGQNVYATNLSGNHGNNTKEYLTTKCYDISSLEVPEISFKMAFELELDWDIIYVEYTIDDGSTWNILGTSNDPNWYNSDTLPDTNCFNCPGAQWTGTSASFNDYSYDLSAFASETSMIFRFVFHSDQSETREGVVIDDLQIGTEQLSIDDTILEGLSIFPNPSTAIFNIQWPAESSLSIEVFDILGKSVIKRFDMPQGSSNYPLDMSSFATGLYLIKLNTDKQQITQKLILK